MDPFACHPAIQRLQRQLDATGSASHREFVLQQIGRIKERCLSLAERRGHAPFPVLPTATPCDKGLWLGDLPGGAHFVLAGGRLVDTTILLGRPGTGKSLQQDRWACALNAQGVTACMVDNKLLSHDQSRRHPFAQLGPLEAAISLRRAAFMEDGPMWALLLRLLEQVAYLQFGAAELSDAYAALRKDLGTDAELCLAHVAHAVNLKLEAEKKKRPYATRYLESAVAAARRVLDVDGGLFSATGCVPLERLLDGSVCVHLSQASPEAARLYSALHAYLQVQRARQQERSDRSLHVLYMLDDSRLLLGGSSRKDSLDVQANQDLWDKAASAGIGLVAAVQSLSDLPDAIVNEAGNLLMIGPQSPGDLYRLRSRLGLSAAQQEWLQHMPLHQGVAHLRRHEFTAPFPLSMPGPDTLPPVNVTRQAQLEAKALLLDGVCPTKWQPPVAASASPLKSGNSDKERPPKAKQLPPQAVTLLKSIAQHPHLLISEAVAVAFTEDVHGRTLRGWVQMLEAAGYARIHKLGNAQPIELLDAVASVVGKIPKLSGRGHFLHNWLMARAATYHTTLGATVRIEHGVDSGRIDVYARLPAGQVVLIEVMMSLSNLESTLAKLGTHTADQRLILCASSAEAAKIKSAIGKRDWPAAAPQVQTAQAFIRQSKSKLVEAVKPR
jgi:hypothetical protein